MAKTKSVLGKTNRVLAKTKGRKGAAKRQRWYRKPRSPIWGEGFAKHSPTRRGRPVNYFIGDAAEAETGRGEPGALAE